MSTELDVYSEWLGIKETQRPLNHYQLFRLDAFEDNTAKIRKQYRKMNSHVRKYSTGKYAKESQDLLNELARAMLALTDERRKREYDATLGRKDKGSKRKQSFEEILLGQQIVDSDQLKKARDYATAVGLELHEALIQQKKAAPDVIMQCYAESLGLPYLELGDIDFDPALMNRVSAVLARQHSCAPILIDQNQIIIASPNPLPPTVEDEIRLKVGMSVRIALCTTNAINEVVNKFYTKEKAQAEMAQGHQHGQQASSIESNEETNNGKPTLTNEEREAKAKNQKLFAFMAFNFGFAGMYFFFNFEMIGLAPSLIVGAIVGGIVFMLMKPK